MKEKSSHGTQINVSLEMAYVYLYVIQVYTTKIKYMHLKFYCLH